jgi:hypothetical protein
MNADESMDRLRLFVSLRALSAGSQDAEALRTVEAELRRLEGEMAAAGHGEPVEPFRLAQADLDNLFLLKLRQSLEPEGKVYRIGLLRWCYRLFRRFILGTQRRYNESAAYLIRRLYATTLLTRYYQLRSLALERRLNDLEARLARLDSGSDRPPAPSPSPPPEARP